jgi:DNA-directed RNA polymerase
MTFGTRVIALDDTTISAELRENASLVQRQRERENTARQQGKDRYWDQAEAAIERGEGASLKPAERLLKWWVPALAKELQRDRREMSRRAKAYAAVAAGVADPEQRRELAELKGLQPQESVYGPFLLMLDARTIATIGLQTVLNKLLSHAADSDNTPQEIERGPRLTDIAYSIGSAVIAECTRKLIVGARKEARAAFDEEHKDDVIPEGEEAPVFAHDTDEVMRLITGKARSMNVGRVNWWANKCVSDPLWSRQACIAIGTRLCFAIRTECPARIIEEAEFNTPIKHEAMKFVPAFEYDTERVTAKGRRKSQTVRHMRLTDEGWEVINEGHAERELLRPRYPFMLVEPCPWTKDRRLGPYLTLPMPYIIKPRPEQKDALKTANLELADKALSAMQATPWRIDRNTHALVTAMVQEGGAQLDTIPSYRDDPKPPKPETSDEELLKSWRLECKRHYRRQVQLIGLRRLLDNRLAVAEDVFDLSFYEPHVFDFRSRAYVKCQPLNHQGDDLCRALMQWSEPRPLTDAGRRWLMIQTASFYGITKSTYDERCEWVMQNLTAIDKSARDPLDDEWWRKAKQPLQFQQACRALINDEEAAHGKLQLDGTCNALQHQTALTLDEETAPYVNMTPSDRPADLYKHTQERMETLLTGRDDGWARRLLPIIRAEGRDAGKAPRMLLSYGGTETGVADSLGEIMKRHGLEGREAWDAKHYLADVAIEAVSGTSGRCTRAGEWITTWAALFAKAGMPLSLVSPIGFPMVQPYRKQAHKVINTLCGEVSFVWDDRELPIKRQKQITASKPNVIHPLDAAHCALLAIECQLGGAAGRRQAFAHNFDGHWTHFEDGDLLDMRIRKTFHRMYFDRPVPILTDMYEQWKAKLPGADGPPPPQQGSYDPSGLFANPYFFSC